MPGYTTPHTDHWHKRKLLDRRLTRLRRAVEQDESLEQRHNATENVRLAQLSLIKARMALIREYPQCDPDGRLASKWSDELFKWQTLSSEAIIDQFGQSDARVIAVGGGGRVPAGPRPGGGGYGGAPAALRPRHPASEEGLGARLVTRSVMSPA
jgi:hypothetical protein